VAEPRDVLPNNFVGDLVHTERGWVVVPPTCCPAGHAYGDSGWSVSGCGAHAMTGTWSGAAIAAQRFTHRSRGSTTDSAAEAQCRCTKTNKAAKRLIGPRGMYDHTD
jgi:hypothetical protein